jgi:hypothetical protein
MRFDRAILAALALCGMWGCGDHPSNLLDRVLLHVTVVPRPQSGAAVFAFFPLR